jgi:hypothetical protein
MSGYDRLPLDASAPLPPNYEDVVEYGSFQADVKKQLPPSLAHQGVTLEVKQSATLFYHGSVVRFQARASRNYLQWSATQGQVNGLGHVGASASHWYVLASGQHVRLQSILDPRRVLSVDNGVLDCPQQSSNSSQMTSHGLFTVVAHASGEISLASASNPSSHVGVMGNGAPMVPLNSSPVWEETKFIVTPVLQGSTSALQPNGSGMVSGALVVTNARSQLLYTQCPRGGAHRIRRRMGALCPLACCCPCLFICCLATNPPVQYCTRCHMEFPE